MVLKPFGYEDGLSGVFAALADPTRRAILVQLKHGDATVAELAAPFSMSRPAVSKHLKVLEQAGLISRYEDLVGDPHRDGPDDEQVDGERQRDDDLQGAKGCELDPLASHGGGDGGEVVAPRSGGGLSGG
jgi:DNA-binding transcriptional ArsR family regulator